jgi:protein involved in polysaccharide export with SLBB domain
MNLIARASLALSLVALFAGGCNMARKSDLQAEGPQGLFRPATEKDVSAIEYRVAPPDKLTIQAPGIKELHQLTSQIRPDGKISINLLGEVFVAGKTPEEINKLLLDAAKTYYNNPDIKVEISEYASKHYSVVGTSIRDQGKKPFTGRDTVVSALAEAGFTDDAWPQQVAISRPARGAQPRATAIVDFKKMAMTGDMTQNYLIEENDIIYIPNSPLAEWRIKTNNIAGPVGQSVGTVGAMQSVGPTGGTGTR